MCVCVCGLCKHKEIWKTMIALKRGIFRWLEEDVWTVHRQVDVCLCVRDKLKGWIGSDECET